MFFESVKKLLGDAFRISAKQVIQEMRITHPELLGRKVNYPVNDYK